jgi:mannitol-1-phosphate 5-dehydrogenase
VTAPAKVVVLGAGRIACGFAGDVLRRAGHEVVFVARNRQVVDHLNRLGRYRLRLATAGGVEERDVDGVRAAWTGDAGAVAAEVRAAALVGTAVGQTGLVDLAPLLAAGLAGRRSPANVVAFENLVDISAWLRRLVVATGGPGTRRHGYAGGLVERVVTHRLGDPRSLEPLVFVGDDAERVVVDRRGLRAALPPLPGLEVTNRYEGEVRRKLATFSAGHAAAAYLGHLAGCSTVDEAVADVRIREAVLGAMAEGHAGVVAAYGREVAGEPAGLLGILDRFARTVLADPLDRVGRDPLRKLSPGDRLVGTARLAHRAGTWPAWLLAAAAAGFRFEVPADPGSATVRRLVRESGIPEAVRRVSGLDPSGPLGRGLVAAYERQVPVGARA